MCASVAVLLSDGIHEGFESAFDRLNRILIPQGCIMSPPRSVGILEPDSRMINPLCLPFNPMK